MANQIVNWLKFLVFFLIFYDPIQSISDTLTTCFVFNNTKAYQFGENWYIPKIKDDEEVLVPKLVNKSATPSNRHLRCPYGCKNNYISPFRFCCVCEEWMSEIRPYVLVKVNKTDTVRSSIILLGNDPPRVKNLQWEIEELADETMDLPLLPKGLAARISPK